jgi:uncharacterized membrane protein YbhN (UPF0104 family)
VSGGELRVPRCSAPSTPDRRGAVGGRRRWLTMGLRAGLVAAALFAIGRCVGARDFARGLALVRATGWRAILVLLATPIALTFDALGWRQILRNLGASVQWLSLTRIRLISEAVVLALPGGAIVAEAAKLTLLRRASDVSPSVAAASLALARALHLAGAAAYLGVVGVILWTFPASALSGWRSKLLALAWGVALFTALASRITLALLREARIAARLADRLQRLPWRRLSELVARHRRHLDELDTHTARYFLAPATTRARASLPYFAQWLIDGAETTLILTLVGAHIGVRGALVVDAFTSFARAAAVFVPAGLGVQEAVQISLLHILGARDDVATAAALIFMKRTKELFWIVTGALLGAATKATCQSKV